MLKFILTREPFHRGILLKSSMSTTSPTTCPTVMTSDPTESVTIKEGKATIHFENKASVFYNPVQEFNRDISVCVLQKFVRQYQKSREAKWGSEAFTHMRVLEAFSASGLRSIRYAKEIEGLTQVIANDISESAVQSIQKNIALNQVEHLVKSSHKDASMAMYENRQAKSRFEIVDLDPYGSPAAFLDGAVQSTAEGGLICVTCTDMAVLCGNSPETCHTKYGSIGLKSKCCHEMALRIVLHSIESHANRYGRYIKPLLSLSIDFYCRVFVTIHTGQKQCKESTSKIGHVYQCTGCETMTTERLGKVIPHEDGKNLRYKLVTGPAVDRHCKYCGNTHHKGGPFWLEPIHDKLFLEELVDELEEEKFGTYSRMKGMLTVASEELYDVPLFYTQDRLCSIIKASSGKMIKFRSALLNAGYRVSLSHANKHALKTDAPNDFIWDMMRSHEKESPINKANLDPQSIPLKLLSGPVSGKVSFELHPEANPASREQQLVRFQLNPERNWGPKTKANAGNFGDSEKRIKNQGKKRKQGEDIENPNKTVKNE